MVPTDMTIAEQQALFDERAGILEYDGGLLRHDAELAAGDYVHNMLFPPAPVAPAPSTGLTLRPYQEDAIEAILDTVAAQKHPVVKIATGGGKSLIIAALCARLPGRILVATHQHTLLEQNSEELETFTTAFGHTTDYGIYSAGLERRDVSQRIIFGGIQSVYNRVEELQKAGPFQTIIVDECHLVAPKGEDVMYSTLFAACQDASRIGLSATPTRMGTPVWGQDNTWFTHLVYEAGIKELTPEYLTPLVGVYTAREGNLARVREQRGEYVMSDASQVFSEEGVARAALAEVQELAAARKKWLFFCCDIAHTHLVENMLTEAGVKAVSMVSDNDRDTNAAALRAFKHGDARALVSCVMVTTGFNVRPIDCIVLLRPSKSRELIEQMLGRGTRHAEGKADCLVLDYAHCLEAGGEALCAQTQKTPERAAKEAKEREARERQAKHDSSVFQRNLMNYRVAHVQYAHQTSKSQPGKNMIMVTYLCHPQSGTASGREVYNTQKKVWIREWICPEYAGFPRRKAEAWFERRGLPCPRTARQAMEALMNGRRAKHPTRILAGKDGEFYRVVMEYYD